MIKIGLIFLTLTFGYANVYTQKCIPCHTKLPVDFDKFFMRYVLEYSSESRVKTALFKYLKAPLEKNSIMSPAFIRRFGVKKDSTLSTEELRQAITIYYETYDIKKRLH